MARRHPILKTLVLFAALGFFLIVGLASYTYLASEGFATFSKNAVAVVTVQGVIEDASDIVRSLDGLTDNEGVRAVVLRVDSPGGGVAPSQEIYGAIERVRERKPVVASLGSVAASGGYYIASACDSIVAESRQSHGLDRRDHGDRQRDGAPEEARRAGRGRQGRKVQGHRIAVA